MDVAVWNASDGRLHLGLLHVASLAANGKPVSTLQQYLGLSEMMQFTQSLPPTLQVKRVKYTKMPLHWNVLQENPANKHGMSTIAVIIPGPLFCLWTVIVQTELLKYDCFIRTNTAVAGCPGYYQLQSYFIKENTSIEFDEKGVPYRANDTRLITEKIFRYVLRYHGRLLNEQQQRLLEGVLPKYSLTRRLLRIQGADFLSYIHSLPGRKMAVFATSQNHGSRQGYIVNGVGELQLFAWIPPWAMQGMERCNHIQLDASFKGSKPYVYCVPQAIIGNRGLACGLVVAPTEREELFQAFHELLSFKDAGIPHPPVLADLGSAIASFCRKSGLQLFMCHRHLLENIGSASFGVSLVQPMLRALSEAEFTACLPQPVADVAIFANHGIIGADMVQKFERMFGCTFCKVDDQYTGEISDTNDNIVRQWALFARGGVATCTNHAEVFHKHVNRRTRENTCFLTKLTTLIEAVKRNHETMNARIIAGIKDKQTKLRHRLDERISTENAHIEGREVCQCKFNARNALLYQCDGFCYHTIAAGKVVTHCEACLLPQAGAVIETKDPVIRETKEIWKFQAERKKKYVKRNKADSLLYCETGLWRFLYSCSLLLDKPIDETVDIVFNFFASQQIDAYKFAACDPKDIAEVKARLIESLAK